MKQPKGVFAIIALLVILAFLVPLTGAQNQTTNRPPKGKPATSRSRRVRWRSRGMSPKLAREPRYVPNQVLVKLESREDTRVRLGLVNLTAAKEKNERLRAEVQETVQATKVNLAVTRSIDNPREGDLLVLDLPADESPDEAIAKLRGKAGVKFVQKNWIYSLQQNVSNDTEYVDGALWGMFGDDLPVPIGPSPTTSAFGTQAEKAWFKGHVGSRAVAVGIIDGGVQVDHPDLEANIWTNSGETGTDGNGQDKSTNGKDDDGDGLVDDVNGWDFAHRKGNVYDAENSDDHGTHVAGTIGATGGNDLGVVGLNWYVSIITAKVFGTTDAPTDRLVEAINFFVSLKERGVNVVAINNSWDGTPYDQLLLEAIKQAARSGILFIAAAGNTGTDNDLAPVYPASYDTRKDTQAAGGTPGVNFNSVIAVAAIDRFGNLASFSNFGRTSVDIGAPGDEIISTIPPNSYDFFSGTSQATPHITGAAALYASTHPAATAEDIRKALLESAIPTPSLQGKTVTGARLNVADF